MVNWRQSSIDNKRQCGWGTRNDRGTGRIRVSEPSTRRFCGVV